MCVCVCVQCAKIGHGIKLLSTNEECMLIFIEHISRTFQVKTEDMMCASDAMQYIMGSFCSDMNLFHIEVLKT